MTKAQIWPELEFTNREFSGLAKDFTHCSQSYRTPRLQTTNLVPLDKVLGGGWDTESEEQEEGLH
jgi:hypothetical protein